MLILIIIYLLLALSAQAQPPAEPPIYFPPPVADAGQESRLRITASHFEQTGDFEKALEIYRNARSGPQKLRSDYEFYKGELRCLLKLQRYDEAEILARKELRNAEADNSLAPRRMEYTADLGMVYLFQSKDDSAWEYFNLAIAHKPDDANTYRLISNNLMQAQKEEQALEVLKKGEAKLKNGELSRDLGMWYSTKMDYKNSLLYYLEYMRRQPYGVGLVENAVLQYPETAQETVLSELKAHEKEPGVVKILASYMFSLKKYDEAYGYIVRSDKDGNELINFAITAFNESRYDLAEKAYSAALDKNPNSPLKPQILTGLAEIYSRTGKDSLALNLYKRIAGEYKNSTLAETALYKTGMLFKDNLNLPDSAIGYFNQVRVLFPKGQYAGEAGYSLAVCAMLKGDISGATLQLQSVIDREGRQNTELRGKAMLLQGRCMFWTGNTDSAFAVWDKLTRALPGTESANDALYDQLCLKEASKEAADAFGKNWLFLHRRQYIQAEIGFKQIADKFGGSVIGARSAVEASNALEAEGLPDSVIIYLEGYMQKFPLGKMRDEIYYRLGEFSLNALNNPLKARKYFEDLLIECPDSPRAGVVRGMMETIG